jgi:periodic tryptophan protein 1
MPNDALTWELHADPECLRWNPHQPHCFAVSDETGRVTYFDTRAGSNSNPLFILAAHPKPVTAIDWNPSLPNCLLTVSADKTVKLWNTQGQVACVASRDAGVGKVFCGAFCFDAPNLVSLAGSNGVLTVVNLLKDKAVVQGFQTQSQ